MKRKEGYGSKEGYGTLPFTKDRYGRERKIVYAPRKITVELVDSTLTVESDGGPDVTGQLTRDELQTVVNAVAGARSRDATTCAADEGASEAADGEAGQDKARVVVVTDAMVEACFNTPQRVPLPGHRLMKETLERALSGANVLVIDLPYLHLHARLAGGYLMKARDLLGHQWNGALDDALNHVDYVKTALDPYVSSEPAEPPPDYKKLFSQAMEHLRIVSGSRNSLTSDATGRLFDLDQPGINLRTPEVEAMHREAAEWLKQHEYLASHTFKKEN